MSGQRESYANELSEADLVGVSGGAGDGDRIVGKWELLDPVETE